MLTFFFMLLGLSNAGISNFGVVALMSGYGVTFSAANIALTAFLGASAAGVLAGGYLADRTTRHGQVAAACFGINAVIMLVIATTSLPSVVLTTAMGYRRIPRRRYRALPRHAGPQRRTSGRRRPRFRHRFHRLQFQRHPQPLLFGWIMDQNMPHWVFGASVAFMVMTVPPGVDLFLASSRNLADFGDAAACDGESASNSSPPLPSAMLPPRITRSGVEVMASIPCLVLLPHHLMSSDAVNRRD